MNELHEKIKSALSEQDGNFIHIHNALEKLKPYLPITAVHLNDRDVVEHIDQMIFRFIKIQDGMGRRLIPLIVEAMEADTSEMTFIDSWFQCRLVCGNRPCGFMLHEEMNNERYFEW